MLSVTLAAAAVVMSPDPETATPKYWTSLFDPGSAVASAYRSPVRDDDDDYSSREGWYLQAGAGLSTMIDSDGPDEDIEFDEGFAIPVAIGYRLGADDGNAFALDLELEGIYTDQDADDEGVLEAVTDVTVLGALLNGVGDFALGDAFSLYIGAGIGLAGLDVGTTSDAVNDFDEEDGPFLAWQAKGGLRWWASDNVSWSIGYRFLNIDDAEIDDDLGGAEFDLETREHILEAGVRFQL